MSTFRTILQHKPLPWQLKPRHKILSLGSCFAANMGHQLASHKFDVLVNPGGILFNPISIARLVRMALGLENPQEFRNADHLPVWHHFDLHSDMSRDTQMEAEANLDRLLIDVKERLLNLDWLILTFGTARVYTYQDGVVANCHQYPHNLFERQLLSVSQMHKEWQLLHQALLQERPDLQVLLTVSPIRHTRDGLAENGVSKALLRVFSEEWATRQENVHYFPAYEIMLDDLRDYRFYESDMIHPNETAQQYIWQGFQEALMDGDSQKQVAVWEQIRRDLNHRPRYPGSEAHVQFLQSIQRKLENQPPHIDTLPEQNQVAEILQQFNLQEVEK